jgi:hypothetical protein
MPKPLYFLTHEGNAQMFSGYGIPLNEGKSPLVGMVMIDRPNRCPESYIKELREVFGEAIIGPMTFNHDRGLYTWMNIKDPASLELVRDDLYSPNIDETRYVLDLAAKAGFLPKARLKLSWSSERQVWLSEFDV